MTFSVRFFGAIEKFFICGGRYKRGPSKTQCNPQSVLNSCKQD